MLLPTKTKPIHHKPTNNNPVLNDNMGVGIILKAVILAAGSSSRMGSPKQLLKFDGETMLDHVIAAAQGAGLDRPVLVLGAFPELIIKETRLANQCEIVVNTDFRKGQSTSLITGVKQIMYRCEGALFMLCDQPFIRADLITRLVGKFTARQPDVLFPVYRQQRGNPVIISSRLFPRLMTITGDRGARFLFNDPDLDIVAYEVDDQSIIIDIDTPEEYEAILQTARVPIP